MNYINYCTLYQPHQFTSFALAVSRAVTESR